MVGYADESTKPAAPLSNGHTNLEHESSKDLPVFPAQCNGTFIPFTHASYLS
jgi:hypothetical protein